MKKFVAACVAGAVSCAVALVASGCGGVDEKYRLYSDPALTVEASSISDTVDISDSLFGLFLEDINYASYALDDNLLANGNFEELGDRPDANNFGMHWEGFSGGSFVTSAINGLFTSHADYHSAANRTDVNPHFARVSVPTAGGGIRNQGYTAVPMAITKDATYKFSAFLRAPQNAVKVTAKAVDGTGKIYLQQDINVPKGSEWIKYERTVTATETGTSGITFVLAFDTPGDYDVDAVSLETTDSTAGVKNYIYNALADLTPKFMRFPGGCIIEGDAGNGGANTKEIYDWKNSIGAVQTGPNAGDDTVPALTYKLDTNGTATETTTYGEWATRSNNYDLWGYNMDYGLGFYDYFVLCEKLGASPVPIVNCGFSDQGGAASAPAIILNGRHGQKVNDYVQDALNLIEFANGDTTTKWGKIREQMGHAEPFNLKYIGIGNEQFFDTYISCYETFLEAFHQAQSENPTLYGGVQPIVGNGLVFGDCEFAPGSANLANKAAKAYKNKGKIQKISEYGVVDHHYYMGYNDFLHFATPENCIYDKYSRDETEGYKVFVGEYSANAATSYFGSSRAYATNTLFSALSEAAYMTGLERNGDVVDLAAYAPMFGAANVNTGARDDQVNQWDVDMMYYTNTQLLLTPNYYVQKMFMNDSGTHYVKTERKNVAETFNETIKVVDYSQDVLYESVTVDEKTGDIIVKFVNIGKDPINLNVRLNGATVKDSADVTVLTGEHNKAGEKGKGDIGDSVNNLKTGYETNLRKYTLGVKSEFGYSVPEYSVTSIRLHTK